MKKIYTFLFSLILAISAMGQTSVITMTSSKPIGSTISLVLMCIKEATPVQIDFGNGVLENYSLGTVDITIKGILVGSKTVSVYGADIYWFECSENSLTALNVSGNTTLNSLICMSNNLTTLDVSKNKVLNFINCSYNKLSVLDVSQNTSLQNLNCGHNNLSTLDVTKNKALTILNCPYNKLSALDVSQNTSLQMFNCDHNNLTALDVSQNTSLQTFNCDHNNLTAIDISENTNLTSFYGANNKLTFASLPQQTSWIYNYFYAPQQPISINKGLGVNSVIDLSDQFSINGTISGYTWKTKGGKTLVNGTDYSLSGGKTTFLKFQLDSVYCEITNATFPDFTGDNVLKTTCGGFPSLPRLSMTTAKPIGSEISFSLSVTASNTSILVDFGDGNLIPYTINSSQTISGTLVTSQTVYIYGTDIGSLDCDDSQLTTLDVSSAVELLTLYCYNNQLTALDVSKNTELNRIYCGKNQLTTLDVKNNTALDNLQCGDNQLSELDVTKNLKLTLLECENNKINALDLSQHTLLTSIYCRNNKLKMLDVSKNTELDNLQCGNNELTALDVSYNTKLKIFYCGNNQLSTLKVSNNSPFNGFSCGYNQLNFSTIPIPQASWINYTYNNQKPVAIVKLLDQGTILDLSSQWTANGNITSYIWKTKTGITLAEGTDYTLTGGKTVFLKAQNDSVYCQMTNATFLDFTAVKPLKTTYTKVLAIKQTQTITFNTLTTKKANDVPFELTASASSALPVTYTSSDPSVASISGSAVTLLKAGTITITATQAGNDTWNAATASQTLNIIKADQTITFNALLDKKTNDAPFQLSATTSSSLQVTYTSSDPSVASISGSTVTLLKAGTITITATQAGNGSWNPATASQTLTITSATGINEEKEINTIVYPNPATDMLYFKGEGSENMNVSIFNIIGANVWSGVVKEQRVTISQLPAGVYILKMSNNKETQTIRFVKQ